MPRGWLAVLLLLAVPLAARTPWWTSETPAKPIVELVPGTAYSVEVAHGAAQFDLDFSSDARYLLIVGSLAPLEVTQTVRLEAAPASAIQSLPVRPILPLPPPLERGAPPAHRSQNPGNECSEPPRRPGSQPTAERHVGSTILSAADSSPSRRTFHLHVTDGPLDDARQYVCVEGRTIAEGRLVRVYLDEQSPASGPVKETAEEIVRLLGGQIIPAFRTTLGQFRDVDGDGRFSVLLTPWLDKLQGGRTQLGGFVRGSDFRLEMDAPFSNRCDMMYLNANLRPGPHLHDLLAHEFAHAVCFSERLPTPQRPIRLPDEEDWLNEAIAHVSESRHAGHWTNLDYRISRFLTAPHESPLVVPDYYRAGRWRDHGCRGATYLFLQWCVDRYGEELLKRLIHAPSRGTQNLEWATGAAFEDLYRHWCIALLNAGLPEPVSTAEQENHHSGGYCSLNLCGPLSKYMLAGPRRLEWDVDGGDEPIDLQGVSTAFFELHASGVPGFRRIRLHGRWPAGLQVSLLKCPPDWPRLTIDARKSPVGQVSFLSYSVPPAGGPVCNESESVPSPVGQDCNLSNSRHAVMDRLQTCPSDTSDRLQICPSETSDRLQTCPTGLDDLGRNEAKPPAQRALAVRAHLQTINRPARSPRFVHVRISGRWAGRLNVEQIACEQTARAGKQPAIRFGPRELSPYAAAETSPGCDSTIGFTLPLPAGWSEQPAILKIVAADAQGRRAVGWHELPAERHQARESKIAARP